MKLKDITSLQWLGIIILFNGTLIGGTNYLSDLFFSVAIVKAIVAVASLGNMFLGGLVTMFGSSGGQATTVSRMDGVNPIEITRAANTSLVTAAADPTTNVVMKP
jgi:hypothetical protein